MTRAIIVDDELPIREWLQYSLKKSQLPIEICALCSNGVEAMEAFFKYRPSLVFSDIKMPGKDGIELLREIRQQDPNVFVVMLTSHDSFEYARKALQYNANEYVLKTEITSDALTQIFNNYQLATQQFSGAKLIDYSNTIPLQDLLGSFPATKPNTQKLSTFLENHLSEQDLKRFFIVAVSLERVTQNNTWKKTLENLGEQFSASLTPFYYNRQILIVLAAVSSSSQSKCQAIRSAIVSQLHNELKCSMGVSAYRHGTDGFMQGTFSAIFLREQQFYLENSTRIFYEEALNTAAEAQFKQKAQDILRHISDRKITEASKYTRRLLECTSLLYSVSPSDVRASFVKIVTAFQLVALSRNMKSTVSACSSAQKNIEVCSGIHSLKNEVFALLSFVEQELGDTEYSSYIQQAISQIHGEYATIKRISDVSDRLGLNTEYFCRVFKQETGITFNNYLTNYRIQIAKQLLNNTELKITDIALSVGYPSLSYFSRVFKSVAGVTPFQFRDTENGTE